MEGVSTPISRVLVPTIAVAAAGAESWYFAPDLPGTLPLLVLALAVLAAPVLLYGTPATTRLKQVVVLWAVMGVILAYLLGIFIFVASILGALSLAADKLFEPRQR